MRISDWSSDVCSSDLAIAGDEALLAAQASDGSVWIVDPVDGTANFAAGRTPFTVVVAYLLDGQTRAGWIHDPCANRTTTDRKSVVEGKSVSVRVDLGGCSIIKKKKKNHKINHT